MVEGSIIGYESNVKSAGGRRKIFRYWRRYAVSAFDQIAVNLRVVNVSVRAQILSSVNTSKTYPSFLMKYRQACSVLLITSAY